jgi:hypothetical protein
MRMGEEEFGPEGIEARVCSALDRGNVDGAVIHAEVVAVHRDREGRDSAQERQGRTGQEV